MLAAVQDVEGTYTIPKQYPPEGMFERCLFRRFPCGARIFPNGGNDEQVRKDHGETNHNGDYGVVLAQLSTSQ